MARKVFGGRGDVEGFEPTSGHVTGGLVLVLSVGVLLIGLLRPDLGWAPPVLAGAALASVLAWTVLLRPRVWATDEHLVLRNALHTVGLPLATIDKVAVGQVLAVSAGQRRYVSPAIGRSRRQSLRAGSAATRTRLPGTGLPGDTRTAHGQDATDTSGAVRHSYPDFVELRITQLAQDARARGMGPATVSRTWAWPEISGLVLTGGWFLFAWLA